MSFSQRLRALAIAGAAASFVLVLEVILFIMASELSDLRVTPRGLGWLALPILAGIAGWKIGIDLDDPDADELPEIEWLVGTTRGRAFVALSGFWIIGWTAYYWLSDEFFGSDGSDSHTWLIYLGGLLCVPAIVFIALKVFFWVLEGSDDS